MAEQFATFNLFKDLFYLLTIDLTPLLIDFKDLTLDNFKLIIRENLRSFRNNEQVTPLTLNRFQLYWMNLTQISSSKLTKSNFLPTKQIQPPGVLF
jgi:hypothetical protein